MNFFQILGVLLLTLLVAAGGVYLYIDKHASSYILTALQNSGFEDAQIGAFEYNSEGFTLTDIRLDKDGYSTIGKITGHYDLGAIIQGNREIQDIQMSDIHLQGHYDDNHTLSISGYGNVFKFRKDGEEENIHISLPVLPFAKLEISSAVFDLTSKYGDFKFSGEGQLSRTEEDTYSGTIVINTDQSSLTFESITAITLNSEEDNLHFETDIKNGRTTLAKQRFPSTGGNLSFKGKIETYLNNDNFSVKGPFDLTVQNWAGKAGDYSFAGLSGNINIRKIYPEIEGSSSNMRIKSIEKDTTVLNNTALKIALSGKTTSPLITLTDVNTTLWEGSLASNKINLSPSGRITSPVKLNLSNFELGKLLSLLKIKGLQAQGLFSGSITLAQSEKGLVISESRLSNQGNGYIRYQPEAYPRALQGDDARMVTVRNALTNFTFDELQTDISGPLDGNLTVALKAKGKNKPLFNDRPIHLNLTIEGALSPLLKSFLKPLTVKSTLNDNKESQ